MKRRGAKKIYQDLKDKTACEQVEYWQQRDESMRRWLKDKKSKKNN